MNVRTLIGEAIHRSEDFRFLKGTGRFVDDLKRKDHYTITEFRTSDVCGANFLDRYAAACEQAAPLVRFLTTAVGGRW